MQKAWTKNSTAFQQKPFQICSLLFSQKQPALDLKSWGDRHQVAAQRRAKTGWPYKGGFNVGLLHLRSSVLSVNPPQVHWPISTGYTGQNNAKLCKKHKEKLRDQQPPRRGAIAKDNLAFLSSLWGRTTYLLWTMNWGPHCELLQSCFQFKLRDS